MSIPVNPPALWSNNQLIAPEKLNRNLFAAKTELEDWAEQQWHRWTISVGTPVNGFLTMLPPFTVATKIYVERIIVYGTYTGQPTLTWGFEGAPILGQFVLPLDGASPQYTVLPGDLIFNGGARYEIKLQGGSTSNLRGVIGLRTSRAPASSPIMNQTFREWGEGDALDPVRFNAQLTELNTFANNWNSGSALLPYGEHYMEFRNFSNSTSAAVLTDRLLGSGGETVSQIVARVELATAGAVGQTVTINAGFGSTTLIGVFSVAGQTTVDFTSALLSLTDSARSPSVAGDDFIVNVSTDGTSIISRMQIYILKTKA